ncbi:MAG: hypothetical protein IKO41_09885 [Lachnospiraceae bacterium]|nr:hypothetical protein [Lachnospiraceae bacterium]
MQKGEVTELIDQLMSVSVKRVEGEKVQYFKVVNSVNYDAEKSSLRVHYDGDLLKSAFGLEEITFEG